MTTARDRANSGRRGVFSIISAVLPPVVGVILLSASAAFGLTKGCVDGPVHGKAVIFPGSGVATEAISLTFTGEKRTTASQVRIWMGKITGGGVTMAGATLLTTITSFTNHRFSKTMSVRRDGKPSGSAGPIRWASDDVVGFRFEELVSGTWQVMDTVMANSHGLALTVGSNEHGIHGVVAVADRADASKFPPNQSNCSTSLPLAPNKFFCPTPDDPDAIIPGQGLNDFLSRKQDSQGRNGSFSRWQRYVRSLEDAKHPMGHNEFGTLGAGFRQANGFSLSATACKTSSATEVCAWYRNENDLGFGRQMHCRIVAFGAMGVADRIACYVSNFANEEDAFNNNNLIATVAMTWTRNREHWDGSPRNDRVTFQAYNSAGATLENPDLDAFSDGEKYTPHLCLNCHGGLYNEETDQVIGAHFLPFDKVALPTASGMTDIEVRFRALNDLVAVTESTQGSGATTDLINGWYATGTFNPSFVPAPWAGNPALYLGVVAPYCRSCHVAHTPSFGSLAEFMGLSVKIKERVCRVSESNGFASVPMPWFTMPHAQRTYQRFWESGANAILNAELGPAASNNGCKFTTLPGN